MKTTPFISASKLVEYAFANSPRRTAIIESVLAPPPFILDTGYSDIERATSEFLASKGADASRLKHLDDAYLLRNPASDHEEQRLLNAHDAIELVKQLDWGYTPNAAITPFDQKKSKLLIAGVAVGINPTVIVKMAQPGNLVKKIGVGKAYFGKSFPLVVKSNFERGTLYAALMHWHAECTHSEFGDSDPGLCFVGDVFAGKVFYAPKNFKQRRKLLVASAQEIADRWDLVRLRLTEKSKLKKTAI